MSGWTLLTFFFFLVWETLVTLFVKGERFTQSEEKPESSHFIWKHTSIGTNCHCLWFSTQLYLKINLGRKRLQAEWNKSRGNCEIDKVFLGHLPTLDFRLLLPSPLPPPPSLSYHRRWHAGLQQLKVIAEGFFVHLYFLNSTCLSE